MVERFNRASLLQGSVAPVSGGNVRVPTDDPQNRVLAQGYNSLANRLDTFKATAFKVAGARAEAAGTAYGAKNPITKAQVEKAASLGQQVEVVGDPTSISVFNQAAYAGSLAVTESQFTAQGRRALSNAMAEAAMDQSMDPQKFTATLDTIINEYSGAMSQISPSSGAKVSAALASMANGQIVSYSRTYATNLKKDLKDDAYSGLSDIRSGLATAIDGYVPPSADNIEMAQEAGQVPASLQDIYNANRAEAESLLLNGGESQKTVNSQLKQLDKDWINTQKNAVIAWAQKDDYADNTGAAYTDLTTGKAPPRIQAVFENLNSSDQVKVLSDMMKIHKQQSSLDKEIADANAAGREAASIKLQSQMNTADKEANPEKWDQLWTKLNKVDPERAKTLMDERELGPVSQDVIRVVEGIEDKIADPGYDRKVELGQQPSLLNLVAKARRNKQMTSETAKRLRDHIFQNQNKELKIALNEAALAFNYNYDTFAIDTRADKYDNLKKYKMAENKMRRFYLTNPEADLEAEMQKIIQSVKASTLETFDALLEQLPAKYRNRAAWQKLVKDAKDNPTRFGTIFNTHKATVEKIKRAYSTQWSQTGGQ